MVAALNPEIALSSLGLSSLSLASSLSLSLASLPDPAAWAANVLALCVGVPLATELGLRLASRALAPLGSVPSRLAQQIRRAALLVCLLAPALALLSAWPSDGRWSLVIGRWSPEAAQEAAAERKTEADPAAATHSVRQPTEVIEARESALNPQPPTTNNQPPTTNSLPPTPNNQQPSAELPIGLRGIASVLALLLAAAVSCGFALGGAELIRQQLRLRRLRDAAEPARPEQLPSDWAELAARAGRRRPPELRFCAGLASPIAFGLWRPTILLPAELADERQRSRLPGVLAHELAHLVGGDPLWNWVAGLACSVCWWQPMVRVTAAGLRSDSEFVADESAARTVGDGLPLADYLATLAERLCHRAAESAESTSDEASELAEVDQLPAELNPASGMADVVFRSELGQRVERLLEFGEQETSTSWPVRCGCWLSRRWVGWLALPLAAALAVACPQWLGRAATLPTSESEFREETLREETLREETLRDSDGSGTSAEVRSRALPRRVAVELGLSDAEPGRWAVPVGVGWRAEPVATEPSDVLFWPMPMPFPPPTPDTVIVRVVRCDQLGASAALARLRGDERLTAVGDPLRLVADDELSVIALRGPARLVLPVEERLRELNRLAEAADAAGPRVELVRLTTLLATEAVRRLHERPDGPVARGRVRVVARPDSASIIVEGSPDELRAVIAQLREWDGSAPSK